MKNDCVVVWTTVGRMANCREIASILVNERLAACVNVLPAVTSVYTWEGVPQVDKEQQLIIKTTTAEVDRLWDVLRSRHPYDVPEFLVVPVIDGSEDYLRWLDRSIGPRAES